MKDLRSSNISVLTRATQRHIPEYGILLGHSRENLKPDIELTGWALQQRRNMSPVRYELGFYITEDGIIRSHCRENLKPYIALTAGLCSGEVLCLL
jgi:hypothetical protein